MNPYDGPEDAVALAKIGLRDQLLAARGELTVAEIGDRARSLADVVLAAPEVRRAASVAAYVSVGREPGTGPLLDALAEAGKRVLLPVLLPDNDLDWAVYDGRAKLTSASRGLLEPTGPLLGKDAIATADVVLVPGLATDRQGHRLGRGGGSYDRALGRVPVGTPVCVLLNSEEILDRVPVSAHDRPVGAAATERSFLRFEHQ